MSRLRAQGRLLRLTVEDLSEGGGPFLGVNELSYHQPVYPGDSLRAESEVLDRRVSDSHKGFGIVTWQAPKAGDPNMKGKSAMWKIGAA